MIIPLPVRLGGLRGHALAAGLGLALGFGSGWTVRDWKAADAAVRAERAASEALRRAAAHERGAVQAAAAAGARAEARSGAVRTVTRTIIERVPVHVSPAADAACAVPLGFVRVHDAAALGLPPAPAAAGRSDEAASGIELSAVARTVAANYGACHEAAEQVRGWQDFYAGVRAAMEAGP